MFSALLRGITERKRAEERIRALHDIDVAITSTLDLNAVLYVLLESISRFLPHPAVSAVRLWNNETGTLEPMACHNISLEEWKSGMFSSAGDFGREIVESKAALIIRDLQTDPRTKHIGFFRSHGLFSYLGAPLIVKDQLLGVLGYYTKEKRQFSSAGVEFLSTLAGQAAVAIHNAQLYEQTKKQAHELKRVCDDLETREQIQTLLKELSQDITTLDLESLLQKLTDVVRSFLQVDICDIRVREPDDSRRIVASGIAVEKLLSGRGHGVVRWETYAEGGKTVRISDLSKQRDEPSERSTVQRLGVRGYLGAPFFSKDEKFLGIMRALTYLPREFSEQEVDLLQQVANGAAIAIQNAHLYEQTKKQSAELAKVNAELKKREEIQRLLKELSQNITMMDLGSLLEKLTCDLRAELKVDVCDVRTLEGKDWHDVVVSNVDGARDRSTRSRRGLGTSTWIRKNRKPLSVADITQATEFTVGKTTRRSGLRGFLGVPLVDRTGEVMGVLRTMTYQPRVFTSEEIELLQQLANGAAVAIENARLYEETVNRRLELEQRTVELERANNVKTEFLGVMSHELRTPLTVIMGYTAILQDKLLGTINQAQQDALLKVSRQSNELLAMISSIMEAVKIEFGAGVLEKYPVDLLNLLDELKRTYDMPFDKELVLIWDCSPGLPSITTDGAKLKMVLQNLVNNAIKFTDKGKVTVSARVVEPQFQVSSLELKKTRNPKLGTRN